MKHRTLFVLPCQLMSQFREVPGGKERTGKDQRALLLCVAAEAESVLLDRKADVRACVDVSNQDEPP